MKKIFTIIAVMLLIGFTTSCATRQGYRNSYISVAPPEESSYMPGIFQVITWPKSGSTLKLKEKLFVRYTFNVPEELCSIWVRADIPSERLKSHINNGFVFGGSSSPVYAFGQGMVIQELALLYIPDRDVMGKDILPDPPEVTVTNLVFTLQNYVTKEYRTLTNKSVNLTWKYEKK